MTIALRSLACLALLSGSSTGGWARLDSATPLSLSAGEFILDLSVAVPNQFGLFYYGGAAAQQPFGDGIRCVGAGSTGTFRFQPASLLSPTGQAQLEVDFSSAPANAGPGALVAGSTWYFQFWYRDPSGPGGSGFNFSNGLRVSFWP